MWNVEKDPWLNPSGGMVTILDRPIDLRAVPPPHGQRRRQGAPTAGAGRRRPRPAVAAGVADRPRVRLRLPPPPPRACRRRATRRQLLDLVAPIYEDPFDRTRPLWVFVRHRRVGAVATARCSGRSTTPSPTASARCGCRELYMERERDAALPPEVDLDGGDQASRRRGGRRRRRGRRTASRAATTRSVGHTWRRQLGIDAARRRRGGAVGGRPRASPGHGRGRGADGAAGPRPADG